MTHVTADEAESIRFRVPRGREAAYDALQVDVFLDDVVRQLRAGRPLDEIRVPRFDQPMRRGGGYAAAEVDAFVARLTGNAPTAPIEPLPEEPGILGRLFGRR